MTQFGASVLQAAQNGCYHNYTVSVMIKLSLAFLGCITHSHKSACPVLVSPRHCGISRLTGVVVWGSTPQKEEESETESGHDVTIKKHVHGIFSLDDSQREEN